MVGHRSICRLANLSAMVGWNSVSTTECRNPLDPTTGEMNAQAQYSVYARCSEQNGINISVWFSAPIAGVHNPKRSRLSAAR